MKVYHDLPYVSNTPPPAGESNDTTQTDIPAVNSGLCRDFVALPSDPAIPLTLEQLDALFPPENRPAVIREMVKRAVQG